MRGHRHTHTTRKRIRQGKAICAYCGAKATTRDHVVPRSSSWTPPMEVQGIRGKMSLVEYPRPTVPACRRCNSALGNRVFPTFAQRRAWVLWTVHRRTA